MSAPSAIGRSLPRLDGGEKVSGLTRFAADLRLPGMLHCRLVLSPHAHARIVGIDGKAAAAVPGVIGVFGGRDLPLRHQDPTDRNRCPLALERVLFAGHPVAAVVAESEASPRTRPRSSPWSMRNCRRPSIPRRPCAPRRRGSASPERGAAARRRSPCTEPAAERRP